MPKEYTEEQQKSEKILTNIFAKKSLEEVDYELIRIHLPKVDLNKYISYEKFKKTDSFTLLHIAIIKGNAAGVSILLENTTGNEADIDFPTNPCKKNSATPLQLAVSLQKTQIVKILIEKGADINLTTEKYPKEPFEIAMEKGFPEIAELIEEIVRSSLESEIRPTPKFQDTKRKHTKPEGKDTIDHSPNSAFELLSTPKAILPVKREIDGVTHTTI